MEKKRLRFSKARLMAVGTRCADHVTLFNPRNFAFISSTRSGGSIFIAHLGTKKQRSLFLKNSLHGKWFKCPGRRVFKLFPSSQAELFWLMTFRVARPLSKKLDCNN
jgi:hypothetical protein